MDTYQRKQGLPVQATKAYCGRPGPHPWPNVVASEQIVRHSLLSSNNGSVTGAQQAFLVATVAVQCLGCWYAHTIA